VSSNLSDVFSQIADAALSCTQHYYFCFLGLTHFFWKQISACFWQAEFWPDCGFFSRSHSLMHTCFLCCFSRFSAVTPFAILATSTGGSCIIIRQYLWTSCDLVPMYWLV